MQSEPPAESPMYFLGPVIALEKQAQSSAKYTRLPSSWWPWSSNLGTGWGNAQNKRLWRKDRHNSLGVVFGHIECSCLIALCVFQRAAGATPEHRSRRQTRDTATDTTAEFQTET